MLEELAVHNFAIIRNLQIRFRAGFNVLSGETGAGKSILVGALNLILGSRASQEMIRTGATEASVEAALSLPEAGACRSLLDQWGIETAPELSIRRSINRSGRNRVFINDQTASLQQIQQLSPLLISISGQHEHQLLLNPDTHLLLLDAYGGLEAAVAEVEAVFSAWQAKREELARLKRTREQRAAELDFVRFQIGELQAAKIRPDEDEELGRERDILKHASVLAEASQRALGALYSDRGAILDRFQDIEKDLAAIFRVDTSQQHLAEYLEQGRIQLSELAHLLQQYAGRIVFDPARLAHVEERLALLGRLGKKYGTSANEMLARLAELKSLAGDEGESELLEKEAEKELGRLRAAYLEKARELSRARSEAAGKLSADVGSNLAELDMAKARFAVRFAENGGEPLFSPSGMDRVEFLLSANPGEELKPLARVASGGELSRILLALKSLLGRRGEAETLIFDEVDAGIGGRTAELVGLQLKRLASRHQVICITHLPQIACYGNWHYLVRKQTEGNETMTGIRVLSEEERSEELARMLGGVSISQKARDHARELLDLAAGRK
ncbi:MAG: DNA repair protein RecN [Desulfobacteraceae bacterium]|nr:DNA repair protein RecN [Desulfobacteraceae bacterium]